MVRTPWILALGALLLTAPTQAQSYTRASLLKFIDDATAGLEQASKAYKEDKALQEDVSAQTTTPAAAPYPEMGQKVREMGTKVRSIKVNQGVLQGKRAQIDLLFGADEEIFSDDRRWRDVRTMVRTLQARADLINADWEMMGILDKEFAGLVRKYGIKGQLASDYIREINSRKDENWKKAADAETKAKNVRQWAKKGACDAATADSLALLAKAVDDAWDPYKAEADRLKAGLKGKGFLYQGPGIPKVTVLEEFEAASKDLKEKHAKFKKDYKEVEAKIQQTKKVGKR